MHVMTLEAEVGSDDFVHLDLPVNLPPGKVDITLEIQPRAKETKLPSLPKLVARSRQERFEELTRLLRLGLGGINWEAIKESRKDDENRY